eukprot:scaffold2109_cov123-Isochrysis_galbana.AAC.16
MSVLGPISGSGRGRPPLKIVAQRADLDRWVPIFAKVRPHPGHSVLASDMCACGGPKHVRRSKEEFDRGRSIMFYLRSERLNNNHRPRPIWLINREAAGASAGIWAVLSRTWQR